MKTNLTKIVPFILLGIYSVIAIVIFKKIPSPEALLESLKSIYSQYGYTLVFVAAVLEASFPIGLYIPGSTAILLGAALSKTGIMQFPFVIVIATVGLVIGQMTNYALGRFGWYHLLTNMGFEKGVYHAEQKLKQHKYKTIFFSYFHPSSASFISTAAGVIKIPFFDFFLISLLVQLFWSLVWGGLAYLVGVALVEFFIKYFSVVVIVGILIWFCLKYLKKNRSKDSRK